MKIGEFAKKHNVTIDTVRHYIAEGLLTPLRENTQYSFSEIDNKVMDTILLLKAMNFKLEEMKPYLLFQTMFTSNSFVSLGSFQSSFEKKLVQNREEIKRLEQMNELIEARLQEYNAMLRFNRGIALSMMSSLKCPVCKKTLELEKPELLHNEIMSGELVCPECGKRYYIRYGLLSDKMIPELEERTDGIADMVENYIRQNDDKYILNVREFYQKAADITKENGLGAKNVMIDGESVGFLNSAILRSLPENVRLFVHIEENATIKYFLEDILPKETIIYSG
nr:MerR family DNA-binding transcriptional regulator [Acetatifactor sp.]